MQHESITKKQIEILLLLYIFRFLHTYQIQKLLNHKKPNQIKVWLKNLTEKEYLNRDYNRHSIKDLLLFEKRLQQYIVLLLSLY